MKAKRHGFLAIIMVMCMMLQSTLTYASVILEFNGIPIEVSSNEYLEIPIKQNGKVISSIKQPMPTEFFDQIGTYSLEAIRKDVAELAPTGNSENNYVVPESISNVNTKVTYRTPAKKVVYTVDLQEICNLELSSKAVFKTLDLSKAIVEITDITGREIISPSSTKYETSVADNKLIIKVKDENTIINAREFHKINIYFSTSFGSGIIYYKSDTTSETYMDLLDELRNPASNQVKAKLTVSRCPKIREAITLDGTIIAEEEYASIPTEHTIDITFTLRQMPSIH